MIKLNRTRADFGQKFEELIESYNAGSRNIEQLLDELLKLSRSLSDEEQRHVRENMSEEELVVFDILDAASARTEHGGTGRGKEGGAAAAGADTGTVDA